MNASSKLKCKEAYFPGEAEFDVDPHQVLQEMIGSLNHEPEAYEENLADARLLAAKLRVTIDPATIPPRQPKERRLYWGPSVNPDGSVPFISVNGDLAGIHDVAAAARMVDALLIPVEVVATA